MGNINPIFSIVIPTFQEEKIIERTLCQFTEQLRKQFNLEIIISDGGSTDKTVELAHKYTDNTIVDGSSKPQNISIGRNRGAESARGEVIIFLNADVIIEDIEKFFRTVSSVMQDKKIVAATCNVNIYPEEERTGDWVFHNLFNGYFWILNIFGMGMGRGECQIIRKKIFNQVGGYNEILAAGEDYELFLRIHRCGQIKFIPILTVYESPRRFRKYGYFWISLLWFLNAIGVLIFNRSIVREWKPVR